MCRKMLNDKNGASRWLKFRKLRAQPIHRENVRNVANRYLYDGVRKIIIFARRV